MKINFNNAREEIAKELMKFEKREANNYDRSIYYVMTESEFDELVANIMNNSTKGFADALKKQTKKDTIGWLDRAKGGRISTYKYNYAFIKFID